MRQRLHVGPTVFGLTLVITLAGSAGAEQQDERRERVASQIEDIRARLALTEEQKVEVEPILRAGIGERISILEEYGIGEGREGGERPQIGLRQAGQLRSDLNEVRDRQQEKLRGILTSEQMEEYELIQEEMRSEMRARLGR